MIFSQSIRARETKNIAGFFEINGSSSSYMLFDNEKILKSAMFTTGLKDFGDVDLYSLAWFVNELVVTWVVCG